VTAVSFDILGHDRTGSQALNRVGSAADRTRGKFGALGNTSGKVTGLVSSGLGKLAGAMTLVAGIAVFKDFIAEARESRKIGNLTANVIKTTGGAAHISAKQVGNLAMAISNKTGIDDEAVQSGANLLLTFKNVRNETGMGADIFNRATAAAIDLSAAGFGSITSTSKSLGKALNDPLKGMTALGKAGVTFTEGQKKQITTLVKSGQTLKAQQLIMTEVESQVGGAAAAAADPLEKLGVIINNQKERIGTALLPVVDKLATWLGKNLPKAIDLAANFFTTKLLPAFKAVFDFVRTTVLPIVGKIVDAFKGLSGKIVDAIGVLDLSGIGDSIWTTASGWATNLINGLKSGVDKGDWKPLGVAISNTAVKALDLLMTKSQELTDKAVAFIKSIDWQKAGQESTAQIIAFVQGIDWNSVAAALGKAILGSLKINAKIYDAVIGAARDLVIGMTQTLASEVAKASVSVALDWWNLGVDIVTGMKNGIVAGAKGVGAWLKKELVDPVILWAKRGFGIASPSTVFLAIGIDIVAGLKNGIVAAARGIGAWIYRTVVVPAVKAFGAAGTWLLAQGRNLVAGFKNGIAAIGRTVGRFVYTNVIQPAVRGFATAGTWLLAQGRNLVAGFKNGILAIGRTVNRFIYTNVIVPAVRAFAAAGTWLVQAGKNAIAGFKNGIGAIAGGIGSFLYSRVISPLVAQFGKAGTLLVQAGKNVIAGFRNGMVAIWPAVTSWVGGIANWIKTHKGPVSLDGTLLIPAGRAIMSGFLTGLKSGAGRAWDFVKSVGGKAKEAIATAYGWLKGVGWLSDIGSSSLTGPQGAGVERWRAIALKALAAAGAPASWVGSLLRRMNQESGGNPRAINLWDSNAKRGTPSIGLMQTIGPTFAAYAGPYRSRGIYDPFANIYAAIKYANARYGAAPRGWDRKGGYKLGTPWVPNDQIAFLHKGEAVVPANVNAHRVRSGMGAGGNVINIHVHGQMVDPIGVAQQIEQVLTKLKNVRRGTLEFV